MRAMTVRQDDFEGAMIDWDRIEELKDELGAEDFPEVVTVFLGEVEDELATLDATTDTAALAARLHFLKGSALNLGFAAFSNLCLTGEKAVAENGIQAAQLDVIRSCFVKSRTALLAGLG